LQRFSLLFLSRSRLSWCERTGEGQARLLFSPMLGRSRNIELSLDFPFLSPFSLEEFCHRPIFPRPHTTPPPPPPPFDNLRLPPPFPFFPIISPVVLLTCSAFFFWPRQFRSLFFFDLSTEGADDCLRFISSSPLFFFFLLEQTLPNLGPPSLLQYRGKSSSFLSFCSAISTPVPGPSSSLSPPPRAYLKQSSFVPLLSLSEKNEALLCQRIFSLFLSP